MRFEDLDNDNAYVNQYEVEEHHPRTAKEQEAFKQETVTDIEMEKLRWKNRRRMAWVSLMSMILLTCLILLTNLVSIDRLNVLKDVITWFYFSCASIIGMYMGATTWAVKK